MYDGTDVRHGPDRSRGAEPSSCREGPDDIGELDSELGCSVVSARTPLLVLALVLALALAPPRCLSAGFCLVSGDVRFWTGAVAGHAAPYGPRARHLGRATRRRLQRGLLGTRNTCPTRQDTRVTCSRVVIIALFATGMARSGGGEGGGCGQTRPLTMGGCSFLLGRDASHHPPPPPPAGRLPLAILVHPPLTTDAPDVLVVV
jgi:hypothetical protein